MNAHRWYTPWLMLAVPLILLAVFSLWPAVNTVVLSFTNVRMISGGYFVGLRNFSLIFEDERLRDALLNTAIFVVLFVPLLTFLPLLLSLLVHSRLPFIGFFRTVFYFPVIASVVAVALIWQWLLDDRGPVNQLAQQMGLIKQAIPFLTDRWLLILSVTALTVWRGLGFYMLLYLSALGNVRRELHEAAAVDGAGRLRRFWSITVPSIRGRMVLVAVLIVIASMRIFTEIYILGGPQGGVGGQNVTVVMLIQQAVLGADGRIGYASALSVFLFALTIGPLLLLAYLNKRSEA
ncbi:carbohydrate ABC transporter permease [Sphaerisporangium fuscum]|uniref:carbohydrate ABC transporter permease n=1 Tax=Sphaerisporangium fuscum TaxID=2835868 RepID=UPI001BDBC2E4|nr:sugar ABC transporter permease [Sphaerisporangium fuscum]